MPRDLSDVLHYFLPELEPAPAQSPDAGRERTSARVRRRSPAPEAGSGRCPLAVLGVPLGERELVHAVYAVSVALEAARQGARVVLLSPAFDTPASWPLAAWDHAGEVESVVSAASDLAGLTREAHALAAERGRSAPRGGVVMTRIPGAWLGELARIDDPFRWLLLFGSARRLDADALLTRLRVFATGRLGLDVGLALVGESDSLDGQVDYAALTQRCERELSLALAPYGVLADDLDVCRAIAAGTPIACESDESALARSIAHAARLVYQDARSRVLG